MRTFVRHAVLLVAATVACQTGLALAEDFRWTSGGGQPATLVGDQKVVAKDQACYSSCDQASCCEESCGSCALRGCEGCPEMGIIGAFGFDSFKGISDRSYQSNFGAVTGLNAAGPLMGLGDYGIGWQTGISYGVYDFDGRMDYTHANSTAKSQQQTFVTTGLYRKASGDQRLSFGMVYDWMFNNQWGAVGNSPTIGQWRGQIEYALSNSNGVGLYGCARDLGSVQEIERVDVTTRAMSQVNMFWHHKFESGADSWLWVGIPERDRLSGDGSLGDWVVGGNVQVPITDRLALYGNAQYMHPSEAAGERASVESAWNVGAGIAWYFGGHAVSNSLNGKCWMPYLPVANNSTFLVDQNYATP